MSTGGARCARDRSQVSHFFDAGLKMRTSVLMQEEVQGEQPMTIAEAMHKATQKGYHLKGSDGMETYYEGANSEFSLWTRKDNESSFMVAVEETFLDPAFWQALGCALDIDGVSSHGEWKNLWHQFIEHLSNGDTPQAFFQHLASPSQTSHRGECGVRNF